MSYTNQPDHGLLDRQLVVDVLMALARASVDASPVHATKDEHLDRLSATAASELERGFLRFLAERGLRLPTGGGRYLDEGNARPDFIYDEHHVVVYIDGPVHEFPDRAARDAAQQDRLEDSGWQVIRFPGDADWTAIVAKYPSVFGVL